MAAIFISHSSRDSAWARRLAAWLKERDHEPFLDVDPEDGIGGGSQWRDTIYRKLHSSQLVLALCSPHYLASEWCLSELAIATDLCKPLVPLQIAEAPLPRLALHLQAINLAGDADEGLQRLALALAQLLQGRDRLPLDSQRPPYPGLEPCQEADAALFFGRDTELEELQRRLRSLRQAGRGLLLLLGASGCGKSSLLRAGLLPQLRLDPATWLVIDPCRPGADEPLTELLHTLGRGAVRHGVPPLPNPCSAEQLRAWFTRLRHHSGHPDASVVVPLDQFEECLFSTAADGFLALLEALVRGSDGRLLLVVTLRSDCLGALQLHPAQLAQRADQMLLNPMASDGIVQVIEGPAARVGLSLEPGLSLRMADDTRSGEALPLLALTLQQLWQLHGRDGRFSLQHYRAFGGLDGAAERVAAEALEGPLKSEANRSALRDAFVGQLVRLHDQGYSRRPARWADLPDAARPLLEALVARRLLVRRGESDADATVELAHESLLRTWSLLRGWLDDNREFVAFCDELSREQQRWQQAPTAALRAEACLQPTRLRRARSWLAERPAAIAPHLRRYIQASQRQQLQRRLRWGAAAAGLTLLALVALNPLVKARTLALFAQAPFAPPWLIGAALEALNSHRWQVLQAADPNRLPVCGGTMADADTFCTSERQVVTLLRKASAPLALPQLSAELAAGHRRGGFGGPRTEVIDDYSAMHQRFTPGALRLTAAIVYDPRAAGADPSGNGLIDDHQEAWMIPCELFREIIDRWRAVEPRCHLFADVDQPAAGCPGIRANGDLTGGESEKMTTHPLAFWIFELGTTYAQDRDETCRTVTAPHP